MLKTCKCGGMLESVTAGCHNCQARQYAREHYVPNPHVVSASTLLKKIHHSEWQTYKAARDRCTNPNSQRWDDYGARGIKFLFTSFEEFFDELGKRPEGMSLDRIKNDGDYAPGNVRWATQDMQIRNQRKRRSRVLLKTCSDSELLAEVLRRDILR